MLDDCAFPITGYHNFEIRKASQQRLFLSQAVTVQAPLIIQGPSPWSYARHTPAPPPPFQSCVSRPRRRTAARRWAWAHHAHRRSYADEIRGIRDRLNMSQGFFADVIGVSKKTIESWEYGYGKPSGAAARMLTIADTDPDALRRYGFAEWWERVFHASH